MSKLDGNERWKSKMLLTEHQEQYENRNKNLRTGRITTEELTMLRDAIMFPYMLTMCNKSLQDLQNSTQLFRQLFEQIIQIIMNSITKDLSKVNRELRQRNIKFFSDETHDGVIYHRYICRGYEDRFGIVREVLRAEIGIRFTKYTTHILSQLKANS
jgi:adenosyl cobinamide kinase/adenosyl cobinamide phosphate guanylyltransferase